MKQFKFIVSAIIISIVTVSSCHKKETVEVDNETQSVVDNAVAEQEFMAMVPATNAVAIKTRGTGADKNRSSVLPGPCDSLHYISGDTTFVNLNSPPTFSMNFNTVGTNTCAQIPDGKIRQGVLFVKLYGKVKTPNSRMVIILQGYKAAIQDASKMISYECDSMVVKTVSNNPVTDIREFNIKIYGGKCVGNGWSTRYTTDRTIRHDMNTDDITIWGTSDGINRLGRKFHVEVPSSNPLVKRKTCKYISSGVLTLKPEGFNTRTVDYGSGNCDNKATFEVNGNKVEFNLD